MAKIKICGLFRDCDAEYVNEAMPDFAGLIFYPKSHRFVSDEAAKRLRQRIDRKIQTVGVFVDDDPEHIGALCKQGIIDIIQLHGNESEDYIKKLRNDIVGAVIWKAFKIRDKSDVDKAMASTADSVVLDNGYGTGESFDWSQAEGFRRKFILAGGLRPENIKEAISRLRPWAVDLSSGVETEKIKDLTKIKAAVAAAREIQ